VRNSEIESAFRTPQTTASGPVYDGHVDVPTTDQPVGELSTTKTLTTPRSDVVKVRSSTAMKQRLACIGYTSGGQGCACLVMTVSV